MAAIKFTKSAGKAQTSTVVKDKKQTVSENHTDETVHLPPATSNDLTFEISEPPCEVGLEASYTHNLGEFRSARVQVSLRVPCAKADIDTTFEQVNTWVEARMEQLVSEMVKS